MPGAFARLKVWGRERLKFSDLNGELDNIISHMDPTGIGSDSATNTAMRAETNVAPYVAGTQTESLPTTLDGEFQGLRFALRRFFGGTYWYTDPGRTLLANPSDMVGSLSFDGENKLEAFAECIRRGAIINPVTLTAADFDNTKLDSTNKKFGENSYDLGASNFLAFPGRAKQQGSLSCHFRNLTAGDYIAYNPLTGVELYLDGAGLLTAKVRKAAANAETTKLISTIAGVASRAANTAFQHVALRWSLGGGTTTDTIGLLLAGVSEGTQISGVDVGINPGQGGVWHLGAKKNDPTWDHYSSMKVLPDAEAVSAWALSGSAVQSVVAAGLLTITGGSATTYTKTNNVNLTQFTLETKFRSNCVGGGFGIVNVAEVSDNVNTRYIQVLLNGDQLTFNDGVNTYYLANLPDKEFHVLRVTCLGSPSPVTKVYLDGVLVLSLTNATAHSAGSTYVQFGVNLIGSAVSTITDFEWFAYLGSNVAVFAPVIADATGQLDDLLFTKSSIADAVITQLMNNSVKSVYGQDSALGITLPPELIFTGVTVASGAMTKATTYVPCDGRAPLTVSLSGELTSADTISLEQDKGVTDIIFRSQVTSAANQTVALSAKTTFPLGLRRLNVFVAAANTFTGSLVISGGK